MSVVGFDIGNENLVVAAARQRGIDVLLNGESNRETPAVVCFGEKQRSLGAAGAASATMNPRSTVSQVKRLIGRAFRDPAVQEDLRRLPFGACEGPDGGVLVRVRYLNEERTFTPVQILAMLLSHLKQIAEKELESPVCDCVIGIPSYATDLQRRAYLDAAAIAGLRPLRLMHDVAATALGYGIYRAEGHATHVVFVDVGHSDTQVAVVEFEAGQMRVLSHASDPNLGGRDFDDVLFQYFSALFKEQYNIDVSSNVRASIRLRAACEKLKKVLSANAEAPISIECLMDEKDVKGFIKREDFERLSSDLLERMLVPCKKALADAKLSLDRVQSVELVGSGSRIPAITRMLAGLFKREPRRTLNASECVAMGCALQCAMLSPTFRVRDYEVQDSFPFSIGFSSGEGPRCTPSSIVFPRGQPFPSVKVLTFHRTSTFHLEAFYADPNELPRGVPEKISHFTIGPFQVSHHEKPKVKVRIRLNLHGIVTVESASLIEGDVNDPVLRAAASSNGDNVQPDFASGAPNSEGNTIENGNFSHPEPGHLPRARSTEDLPAETEGTKMGRPSRRFEIPVTEACAGMTKAELSEAEAQEVQLESHDRMVERTKEKKNALEAYVYEIRNKLFEKFRSFTTEPEREEISRNLQQTEDWIYDEGDDESENVYNQKLDELKKVIEECNKAEQWIREQSQLQEPLPKNTDPILWSSDIKNRTEALHT
ncbi:hypothetical protein Taro_015825 [Colocasia esculenta]|uniref:Heat shock 70 kDa protein 16 n=1 Tax=Colocasia esculenta TaxID=4460 RepID=A0A843UIN3_COLES|nr:hypothetical protein [Colocasia esculenta]